MEEWTKVVSTETEPMRVTPWGGHIWWLTYPAVTGSDYLTTAIIDIFPGQGHSKHLHDSEEVLYVLEGTGTHTYFCEDGTEKVYKVKPGDLMFMKVGQYHSTVNDSNSVLKVLAYYTHREIPPIEEKK